MRSQKETAPEFTDSEIEKRRETAINRMLSTPHKPHSASKVRDKESSQSK